jgi:hypothetical protein
MVVLIDGGSRGRLRSDRRAYLCLGDGGSNRRGQPRTAALRLKSFRVLGDGASDRRGAVEGGLGLTEEYLGGSRK